MRDSKKELVNKILLIISIWDSDVSFGCYSDTTAAAIFVIDKYNEVNNTCSGRFSFNTSGRYRNQNLIYEIRDGIFTVPLYR